MGNSKKIRECYSYKKLQRTGISNKKIPTVLLGTVHCSTVFKPFLLKEEVGRENQVNHEEKNARPTLFM